MQHATNTSLELEPRLQKIRNWAEANLTKEENGIMERHIELLRTSGATDHILKKGDRMPEFQLKNQEGAIISATALLKNGPLVVSFYRGSWCPYCAEEVRALNSVYQDIRDAGADLVVVSPQSFSRTERQANELHLQYNMLVDEDNKIGKAFGLVYLMPQELQDLYWNKFRNNIQEINEGTAWELPIPARFIIGTDGIILDVQTDPDYRYRPEPAETVNFLKQLQ